jgi:pyruvate formate lyase activating enzyme
MSSGKEKAVSKRDFVKLGLLGILGLTTHPGKVKLLANTMTHEINSLPPTPEDIWKWSKVAYYQSEMPNGIKCELCPNGCVVREGNKGLCRTRIFYNGKIYTIAYGNPCSVNIDPIEKKPLFHFYPKSTAYSLATAGCTMACLNCQNWDISQKSPEETTNYDMMPEIVVEQAIKSKSKSIAYTYSEPIAFYEYTFDTSKIARSKGIKNVLISNGYINAKPLEDLCQFIDAANINLKSFDNNIYMKLNAGTLQPILNTLKILKERKVWLEITNLIVPTWTDKLDMIQRMCEWLVKNGFQDTPLHFNRFFPMYKLKHLPAASVEFMEKARNTALNMGMKYVYLGNVPGHPGVNTYCPKCKKTVVERKGYTIGLYNIENGSCKFCNEKIAGVW